MGDGPECRQPLGVAFWLAHIMASPYGSLILWPHLMDRFIVTPLVAEILITFNTLITFQPLKRNRDRNRPAGPARAVTELATHRGLASALLTTITNW